MNLYFECSMGAAGDMLAAALLDTFDNKEEILRQLNALSLPHTEIKAEQANAGGIVGTRLHIIIDGEEEGEDIHPHHTHGRSLADVLAVIDGIHADETVKGHAKAIYRRIADAEAQVHGRPVGEVHFHELGMRDAIADVTVCAYLLHLIQPEEVLVSPVNVGGGTVHCAHGELPVPAPATAALLNGVPYYKSDIKTELCTPTGAAILTHYATAFTETPQLGTVRAVGTGAGKKALSRPNLLRAFLCDGSSGITELSCNIDDMTGEELGFAAERMMQCGARDCFITPIIMKKGRPAQMLTVLCNHGEKERFAALIFKHTTTLGIRVYTPSRYTLERTLTKHGGATIKRSEGYGTAKEKIEFEDLKQLALEEDISLFEARERIKNKSKG